MGPNLTVGTCQKDTRVLWLLVWHVAAKTLLMKCGGSTTTTESSTVPSLGAADCGSTPGD